MHSIEKSGTRLVFWQNMLSPHQSAYIRTLAKRTDWDVWLVVQERLSSARRGLGWEAPDLGRTHVVVAPDRKSVGELAATDPRRSIHILGGLRGYHLVDAVRRTLPVFVAGLGLVSECAEDQGLKGCLRHMVYVMERWRLVKRPDFVLAMGTRGHSWFQKCGFDPVTIFPFAYVREPITDSVELGPARSTSVVKLVFVGELAPWKAVDVLFRALSSLTSRSWELTLIGDGSERSKLSHLAKTLQLEHRIHFVGAKPSQEVIRLLKGQDLLILPSWRDGWGVVVNEALMAGTPAICSDRCGARDLLAERWRGETFRAGDTAGLARLLAARIESGRIQPELRHRIRQWSECISGESVAAYFEQVLHHIYQNAPRPAPPWRLAKCDLHPVGRQAAGLYCDPQSGLPHVQETRSIENEQR